MVIESDMSMGNTETVGARNLCVYTERRLEIITVIVVVALATIVLQHKHRACLDWRRIVSLRHPTREPQSYDEFLCVQECLIHKNTEEGFTYPPVMACRKRAL